MEVSITLNILDSGAMWLDIEARRERLYKKYFSPEKKTSTLLIIHFFLLALLMLWKRLEK